MMKKQDIEKRQRTMKLWNRLRTALYYEKRANRKDPFTMTIFPQEVFAGKDNKPFIRYFVPGQKEPFLMIRKREGMVTEKQIKESSKTAVDMTGIISKRFCRVDSTFIRIILKYKKKIYENGRDLAMRRTVGTFLL